MYVSLETIKDAIDKEYQYLAQHILNGLPADIYRERIAELKGIVKAAGIVERLFKDNHPDKPKEKSDERAGNETI